MSKTSTKPWLDINLRGMNLLEASAGTGKTYTVALLYIRALLGINTPVSRPMQVSEILVVTFTNAATEELISRIRDRIREALEYIDEPGKDKALVELLQVAFETKSKRQCHELLKVALGQMSFANISTIHQFSSNICNQVALSAALPVPIKLSIDNSSLQQAIDDIWRQNIEQQEALYNHHVSSYENHKNIYSKLVSKTLLRLFPESIDKQEFFAQREQDPSFRSQVEAGFPLLNGTKKISESLDLVIAVDQNTLSLPFDTLNKLSVKNLIAAKSASKVKSKAKQDEFAQWQQVIENSTFLNYCQKLAKQLIGGSDIYFSDGIADFKTLFENAYHDLFNRLERVEQTSGEIYSDRLLQLAANVTQKQEVSQKIRCTLPLAIIDEFQDTDPFQYQLFSNIYQGENCGLLMVGDPKQAIYRFRGGDIYTYLKAKKAAQANIRENSEISLSNNFRSCQSLITGLNAIFMQVKDDHKHASLGPFAQQQIGYQQINAKSDKPNIQLKTQDEWCNLKAIASIYNDENEEGTLTALKQRQTAARDCVTYVEKILLLAARGRCALRVTSPGKETGAAERVESVKPADIAFLVNNHKEAALIKSELSRLKIPSLTQSKQSIFQEQEAYDCWVILKALLDPQNIAAFNSALAVSISGLSKENIYYLLNNDAALQEALSNLHQLSETLNDKGPLVAIYGWLEMTGAKTLVIKNNNERSATNLLQLLELLQEEYELIGGGEKLVNSLEQKMADDAPGEENVLRLESDDERVRIVTIHTSKGLEYPIVLVPFAWRNANQLQDKLYDFHVEDEAGLSFDKNFKGRQEQEQKEEKLRLFYVALTRAAQHLCIHFMDSERPNVRRKGPTKNPSKNYNNSPLGWFFPTDKDSDTVAVAEHNFRKAVEICNGEDVSIDDADFAQINSLQRKIEAQEEATSTFTSLDFTGKVDKRLGITSFTQLSKGYEPELGDPDSDTDSSDQTNSEVDSLSHSGSERHELKSAPSDQRFKLAKGASIGSALHKVLENTDFTLWNPDPLRSVQKGVAAKHLHNELTTQLKSHGLWESEGNTAQYAEWLSNAIQAPFVCAENKGFTLALLQSWLPELSFTFKLSDKFGKVKLKNLLAEHDYALSGLKGTSLHGMLTGEIDLVFEQSGRYYIADYKSNGLGDYLGAYDEAGIQANIEQKAYNLQYLIYTLALHKFLQLRIPNYEYEQHFGGVYYLYLRGMTPQYPDNGVFFDRPTKQLVEKLDQLFCKTAGSEQIKEAL